MRKRLIPKNLIVKAQSRRALHIGVIAVCPQAKGSTPYAFVGTRSDFGDDAIPNAQTGDQKRIRIEAL
jgi:hypothetical protein